MNRGFVLQGKRYYKYKLTGVDKSGDFDRSLEVRAINEQEAIQLALDSGLTVHQIEVLAEVITSESLEKLKQDSLYEYFMVQIPPGIVVRQDKGRSAASYLQSIVNKHAKKGWEFFRIDPISVDEQPGCLGGLLGERQGASIYHVITFRRAASK